MARVAVALGVLLALAAGTFWGDDEHFPFGPFRMYSVRNDPDGSIIVTRLRGISVDGKELNLSFGSFGLRRAEVDGQLWRFADDDRLAALMMKAYTNMGSGPPLSEMRIMRIYYQLKAGRTVSSFERTLGTWRRSD